MCCFFLNFKVEFIAGLFVLSRGGRLCFSSPKTLSSAASATKDVKVKEGEKVTTRELRKGNYYFNDKNELMRQEKVPSILPPNNGDLEGFSFLFFKKELI